MIELKNSPKGTQNRVKFKEGTGLLFQDSSVLYQYQELWKFISGFNGEDFKEDKTKSYARVLLNCFAFAICFSDKRLFSVLYFISFVCDAVDGWCARKFNQVSTFGAVLDMVTDRISTACLLVILSQVYRPGLVFVSLLALDICSHWLQMYSTFLSGKTNHKDVKDSTNWLFKAYYGNRMFMGYCCVACEVLYLILFLIAKSQNENLVEVVVSSVKQGSLISFLLLVSLFGWAIKQLVNVIQMKTAADVCVLYDIEKKQKP